MSGRAHPFCTAARIIRTKRQKIKLPKQEKTIYDLGTISFRKVGALKAGQQFI